MFPFPSVVFLGDVVFLLTTWEATKPCAKEITRSSLKSIVNPYIHAFTAFVRMVVSVFVTVRFCAHEFSIRSCIRWGGGGGAVGLLCSTTRSGANECSKVWLWW